MAYLDEFAAKINRAYLYAYKKDWSTVRRSVEAISTLVSDLSSYQAAVIKVSIIYPEDFPGWDELSLEDSYLYLYYLDPETGYEHDYLFTMNFKFLESIGLILQPGQQFDLYLTMPSPVFYCYD